MDEPTQAAPQRVEGNQRKVLEALDAYEAEGMTAHKLMTASGVEERAFYRAVEKLLQAGYVCKTIEGGRKAPYIITAAGKAALA